MKCRDLTILDNMEIFCYGTKGHMAPTRENLEDKFIIGKKGIMRKRVFNNSLHYRLRVCKWPDNDSCCTQEKIKLQDN